VTYEKAPYSLRREYCEHLPAKEQNIRRFVRGKVLGQANGGSIAYGIEESDNINYSWSEHD